MGRNDSEFIKKKKRADDFDDIYKNLSSQFIQGKTSNRSSSI